MQKTVLNSIFDRYKHGFEAAPGWSWHIKQCSLFECIFIFVAWEDLESVDLTYGWCGQYMSGLFHTTQLYSIMFIANNEDNTTKEY